MHPQNAKSTSIRIMLLLKNVNLLKVRNKKITAKQRKIRPFGE